MGLNDVCCAGLNSCHTFLADNDYDYRMVGRSCYISATCFTSTFRLWAGSVVSSLCSCVHLIKNTHESCYPGLRSCLIETCFLDLFPTSPISVSALTLPVRIASVSISTCFYSISIRYPFPIIQMPKHDITIYHGH